MAYRTWNKMDPQVQQKLLQKATYYLDNLDSL